MNKNTKTIVWAVAAIAVVALGFAMFSPSGGAQVEVVDSTKLTELAGSGVTVVDVRTPGEFEAGHVPGAINIPVDQMAAQAAALDPAQPVAVYCATGSRSASAVQYLTQAGFKKIYHFDQGMVAWNGDIERGTVAVAPAPVEKATDTPVLYEFYTDW